MLRRGSAAVVAVVVAALLPADRAGTDGPVRTSAVDPAHAMVRIDTARLGRAVPHAFLGLSTEWDSVVAYAGPAGRRRGALRVLLAPLVRETHGLALRVGGDTADQARWNPGARPRPVGVLEDITRATLDALACLARSARGPVTLDVNLTLRDARYGLPVRVTELNSAACGGRPGLSDGFVSALWLTDTLFALLRDGADQANVHTWLHARYALFDIAGTSVHPTTAHRDARLRARGAARKPAGGDQPHGRRIARMGDR